MAMLGLYLLANFSRLFRGAIKNEFLRRNAAAWVVIFLINSSTAPLSGGNSFFYVLAKHGIWLTLLSEVVAALAATLIGFNVVWAVAVNKRLKRLSFLQHKLE